MKRVFISCPPMLAEQEQIKTLGQQFDLDFVCADVVQTLTEEELIQTLPEFDGWIAGDDPGSSEVLQKANKGRMTAVVKWGIGIDNIDTATVAQLGLKFANTPGMFNNEVADLALGYLLALVREIVTIDQAVREGRWIKPQGISLAGKRAGVIGLGNIGRAVIDRLHVVGMQVSGYDPFVSELTDVDVKPWPEGVDELDFLFLCCALTDDNRHLINADVLSTLPEHAFVINVSRGPLIDEHALIVALESQQIAGAALDVFEEEPLAVESPLMTFPRVILGSHNASNTREAVQATNQKAVELIAGFLNG